MTERLAEIATARRQLPFRRVLLKISGEALMGPQGYGLHPPTVDRIAGQVEAVRDLGVEICMVIGGGNIFRGLQLSAPGHGAHDGRLHGDARHRDERARHAVALEAAGSTPG
jgi:hypothetical protein